MPVLGDPPVTLEEIAFLGLAGISVVTALAALLTRELVHTIVWIASFFVSLAGIYFLLQAPFLGVLQLGVYAGAVTILLFFGVMVTRKRIFSREAAAGLGPAPLGLALLSIVLVAVGASTLPSEGSSVRSYDPSLLSQALFGPDGPWLLLLGLAMLGALVGAIFLVREGRD
jgi:NADH-quinone oxidoreductase subunit J